MPSQTYKIDWQWLPRQLRRLDWPQRVAFGLLGLWVALLLAFFLRSPYIFEGNLTVREMGFTYVGAGDRRFLNPIENILQLKLQGQQPEGVLLTGTFTSDDSALAANLNNLTQLTLQLPYAGSKVTFDAANTPETDGFSPLSIRELRFESGTRVEALHYGQDNLDAALSFCLEAPVETGPSPCSNQYDGIESGNSSEFAALGNLVFQFEQPLIVTVEQAAIPEIDLQAEDYLDGLSFEFIPDGLQERSLVLASPSRLYIVPPNFKPGKPETDDGLQNWFWQDFTVENVVFARQEGTYTVADEVSEASTILAGEVRTGNQTMSLQESQLLIIPPKDPGIGRLRFLHARSTPQAGLQTLVSGKARELSAGFYRDFPVETIRISRLAQYPQEAVNALLAFVAALTGFFLPKLFI